MNPLRQQMLELMVLKGFAVNTQKTYLYHITRLTKYFNRSPSMLVDNDIRRYLLHCHQVKHWSYSSCRQSIHAARFFFDQVLERPLAEGKLPFPKKEEKIPELLSKNEVRKIIGACQNSKHQTGLKVAYATGLRVSEIVKLKVRDLDGERGVIRVIGAKGHKDREVDFTDSLRACLRAYWREFLPHSWLFYSKTWKTPLSKSSLQKAYTIAKLKVDIHKRGGIHALRHAYATHQLEAGMPLPQLQQQLGHAHISCTLRYTRWLQYAGNEKGDTFDLLNTLKVDE